MRVFIRKHYISTLYIKVSEMQGLFEGGPYMRKYVKWLFFYYVRVFWGFFEPPTHQRKDIFATYIKGKLAFPGLYTHPPLCPYVI